MTQTTLSKKERGERPWYVDELLATAVVLEVPAARLLPDGQPYPSDPRGMDRDNGRQRKASKPSRGHSDGPRDFRYVTPPSMPTREVKVAA